MEMVTRSIRIPKELLERIATLAQKQHWSVNKWMVITLDRESKARN